MADNSPEKKELNLSEMSKVSGGDDQSALDPPCTFSCPMCGYTCETTHCQFDQVFAEHMLNVHAKPDQDPPYRR